MELVCTTTRETKRGNSGMSFNVINEFEEALAHYTGAKWAIMTDNCTNALELCFRYDKVQRCNFSAYTYLSIYQLLHKLNVLYTLKEEVWQGEYHFHNTRIWDCARKLEQGMYKENQLQCLSFGYDKPLYLGWGGAILTDDKEFYEKNIRLRYDGRTLNDKKWSDRPVQRIGYHMRPTPELAQEGLNKIANFRSPGLGRKANELYPNGRDLKWE